MKHIKWGQTRINFDKVAKRISKHEINSSLTPFNAFNALRAAMIFILLSVNVSAEDQSFPFADPVEQQRFHQLTKELRCLVCQNQSLADSDAPLANDLRKEVYTMMQEGKDNDAIIEFLVARYGEFVLYKPRVNQSTLLLWGAPVLLVLLGLGAVFLLIRRHADKLPASDSDLKRVRKLLEEEDS